ncbi:hypothetical protein KRR26_34955 [Corallococcus sp. M34]|uniref:hypothetical protein n=1 Tax=Citreicoccus inhibens TaxID=2849499 RepID=UPI001C21374E|nr:hypothetical protein [Citreicoccus inhibens]MBU8900817.1 hypothetical protein [Citreicoccus inhibens]
MKRLLDGLSESERRQLYLHLRHSLPKHPMEERLMVSAEGILEAFARAGDLTVRMIRGVIAEGSFAAEVLPLLAPKWRELRIEGADRPYDFLLTDSPEGASPQGPYPQVKVQVKMQRSEGGKPLYANNQWKKKVKWPSTHFIVELQKSRAGETGTGESTRPYRFGEFDLLAVSLGPARGRWSAFIYTVERWLLPDFATPAYLLKYQPVAPSDCDCWTTDFNTAVRWLRSGVVRRITSDIPTLFAPG